MVTTTGPLLLCSLLSLVVHTSWGTDPLLLEYSDYYYDLYYGDYEDYNLHQPGQCVEYLMYLGSSS